MYIYFSLAFEKFCYQHIIIHFSLCPVMGEEPEWGTAPPRTGVRGAGHGEER